MSDPRDDPDLEPLRTAVADRYRIERLIGSGGAAKVYRAHDLKLGRDVALKLLRPELAATLQRRRFLREIDFSAHLTHPNILPVFDAGDAADFLYFTMPLVEGESLRDRLDREGQLPIPEAVRIAKEIATALGHAHEKGIIHRDVKPDNVLLPSGEVVVADFGVASAVRRAGTERLTRTGLSIGTPLYMSPEQGAGDERVDARSDLYALGCVLYELLSGSPPFQAATISALLARHAQDAPPRLRVVRPTVPLQLERLVLRLLAKSPADRFQTAHDLVGALARVEQVRDHVPWPSLGQAAAATLAAAALTTLIVTLTIGSEAADELDAGILAIVPFALTGAAEASLSRDVVRLLHDALTGEGGPKAADLQAVDDALAALRGEPLPLSTRSAQRVAAEIGAGLVIKGAILATGDTLVVRADVIDVVSGEVLAAIENLRGERIQLEEICERLAIELLVKLSPEPRRRLPSLLDSPLESVRAYLEGRRFYRQGRFSDAVAAYEKALRMDSTLAHAGLGMAFADLRLGELRDAGVSWTLPGRTRLNRIDSLQFMALAGAAPLRPLEHATLLESWELVSRIDQENPDNWVELGWGRLTWGPLIESGPGVGTPGRAFEVALQIDPNHVPALEGLLGSHLAAGDTVQLRGLWQRYQRLAADADNARLTRWRVLSALNSAQDERVRSAFIDSLSARELRAVVSYAQVEVEPIDDATRALDILERITTEPDSLRALKVFGSVLLLNIGRPVAEERFRPPLTGGNPNDLTKRVLNGLYWGADTVGVSAAIDAAEATRGGRESAAPALNCSIGLWRAAQGRMAEANRSVAALDRVENALQVGNLTYLPLCAMMIEAQVSATGDLQSAGASLAALELLSRRSYAMNGWVSAAASLLAADLYERSGDVQSALRAIARRPPPEFGPMFLSSFLIREGRLAEIAGQTGRAARAYQRYLRLRPDPEDGPAREETERVRADLDRLLTRVTP